MAPRELTGEFLSFSDNGKVLQKVWNFRGVKKILKLQAVPTINLPIQLQKLNQQKRRDINIEKAFDAAICQFDRKYVLF